MIVNIILAEDQLEQEIRGIEFDINAYYETCYLSSGLDSPYYQQLLRQKNDLESALKVISRTVELIIEKQ